MLIGIVSFSLLLTLPCRACPGLNAVILACCQDQIEKCIPTRATRVNDRTYMTKTQLWPFCGATCVTAGLLLATEMFFVCDVVVAACGNVLIFCRQDASRLP